MENIKFNYQVVLGGDSNLNHGLELKQRMITAVLGQLDRDGIPAYVLLNGDTTSGTIRVDSAIICNDEDFKEIITESIDLIFNDGNCKN